MKADDSAKSRIQASLATGIRDATPGDADSIESVHYASREAVYEGRVDDWPPKGPDRAGRIVRWRHWLSDPSIHCLVLEEAGEIVGFCTVRPSPDEGLDPATVAELPTLYVRPDAWHQGYGRTLCGEALARASTLGFRTLTLWVMEVNERARAFYAEFGFEPDGARKVDGHSSEGLMADRYRIEVAQP